MQKHIAGGRKGAMPKEAMEYASRVFGRMQGGATQPVSGAAHALPPDKRMMYQGKIDAIRENRRKEEERTIKAQIDLSMQNLAKDAFQMPEAMQEDYITDQSILYLNTSYLRKTGLNQVRMGAK